MPSAAIVIPAYNAAETIGETLASVWRAADHACERLAGLRPADVEVIVVDDCSDDDTAAVVRRLAEAGRRPVRYLRQPVNRGPSAARNAGAAKASAEVLFFLDADDAYEPQHLWLCLALMQRFPFVEAVRTGILIDAEIHEYWYRALVNSWLNNLCVRRRTHAFIGGFDEILRIAEDAEYSSRLAALASLLTVASRTVHYRLRPGNSLERQLATWQAPPGNKAVPWPDGFAEILAESRPRHDRRVQHCLAQLPGKEARTLRLGLEGSDEEIARIAGLDLTLSAQVGVRRGR